MNKLLEPNIDEDMLQGMVDVMGVLERGEKRSERRELWLERVHMRV